MIKYSQKREAEQIPCLTKHFVIGLTLEIVN